MSAREKRKRKKVWFAAIAAIFVIGVVMSASLWAAEKQELAVWHSKATHRGKVWAKMVEDFNASHPNIKVTATYQGGYEQTIQKITAGIAGNATPDVAEVPQYYGVPQFAESGKLQALDDLLGKGGKDDFYEPALARYTYKGKLYAIPNAMSTTLLYYNVNAFKDAGLDPDNPPQTWDELVAAGVKLTRDTDGDGKADKWGLVSHTTVNGFLYSLIHQNGGDLYDAQGNPAFNSPEAVAAFQYWSDLVYKHKIMPPLIHSQANKLFIAGTAAMMYQSSSMIKTLDRSIGNRFRYKVAFMPKKKRFGTEVGGTAIGIFKSNPKREAAAREFVKWITDAERAAFWAENTGYIATRKSCAKLPGHMKFLKENPNDRVSAEQMPYTAVSYASKGDGLTYLPIKKVIQKIETTPDLDIKKELDNLVNVTKVKLKEQ